MSSKWDDNEIIQRFREYLKIPSVHPNIDYGDCVKFLKKQACLLNLPVVVHELVPNKPVLVITWEGLQPELPSILLNSHMDVVPVYEEHWTYPPFDAVISEDGNIYARGTQDMKGIGMMHIEAIRKLKDAGVRLKRTVHITFVPDEEIGGLEGMAVFSESDEFKKLNIGFELDESVPNPNPSEVMAFCGERTSRQIIVTCRGEPGHGSLLQSNTAGEKLHYIIEKFMSFRAEEKKKADGGIWVGEVTTINLTQLSVFKVMFLNDHSPKSGTINMQSANMLAPYNGPKIPMGGVQINVLPESLSVSFDIRIAPDVDHDAFDEQISRWCKEAGEGVTFEYIVKNPQVKSTRLGSLPFWGAMQAVASDMGFSIKTLTCPGATDARYVRRQGIPAINFSPIMDTPVLIHAHDERIHVDVYLRGIDIMEKIVEAVANV